ncbi:sensor histidine kinase [Chryseobacterium sp. A301]
MNSLSVNELKEKISSLEKKLAQAETANKNNKAWISLLSHDFRGFFANLTWLSNLYENKTIPLEAFVDLIPELDQNAQKNLTALEDTFLALKFLIEKESVGKDSISLVDSFARLKAFFNEPLLKKELSFTFVGEQDCSVIGNEVILSSVLRKVVDNAIKYSHRGGEIYFHVETTRGNRCQVRIQDFGSGIDEHTLGQVFSFDVVSARGTDGEIGAGIGLVLVKEALHTIGGEVSIESTKDKGTQVKIIL